VDDDEATRLAHREEAFGDMLRVLHGKEAATEAPTLDFITTLAVLADRFDCAAPVSKIMASGFKFKWPITQRKGVAGEDPKMSRNIENTLREKVLVSWLLNQPTRFQASTKELIMNGSKNWSAFPEQDEGKEEATWWHLQDGIEGKLTSYLPSQDQRRLMTVCRRASVSARLYIEYYCLNSTSLRRPLYLSDATV
jgi:hypothetical protein